MSFSPAVSPTTMQFTIAHHTIYHYGQPVTLQPHLLRLYPRNDATQTVQSFHLTISPDPLQISPLVDLDGNHLLKVWFQASPTPSLVIDTTLTVFTHRVDPFNFLLDPWATQLPWDYPDSLRLQLQPYLVGQPPNYAGNLDPVAIELAHDICHQVQGHPIQFLNELNQRLYQSCQQVVRETGQPWLPSYTWATKQASCRDVTVLFMEVCRAIGLAARFVSGYQEGDPDTRDRHLHAWAEVYLPGAGWRGYDPTHGLAVSDRHIALVASAIPSYAAPIVGAFYPGSGSTQLTSRITLETRESSGTGAGAGSPVSPH